MNSVNDELLQFTNVNRYRIEEVLGYGDLGRVYKAWSLIDQQWVAIKVSTGEHIK
jgi:serine/threonine protein kinase